MTEKKVLKKDKLLYGAEGRLLPKSYRAITGVQDEKGGWQVVVITVDSGEIVDINAVLHEHKSFAQEAFKITAANENIIPS